MRGKTARWWLFFVGCALLSSGTASILGGPWWHRLWICVLGFICWISATLACSD